MVSCMSGLLPANIKKLADSQLLQAEELAQMERRYANFELTDLGNEYELWKARWRNIAGNLMKKKHVFHA